MVHVRTVFESDRWRNKVDGLQQGTPTPDRSAAVAAGRAILAELGGTHDVHDVDGRVVEHTEQPVALDATGPLRYIA